MRQVHDEEREKSKSRAPLRDHGCLAANDPRFERLPSFESSIIGDAILIVVWSGNEIFNAEGEVREPPIANSNSHADRLS